MLIESRNNEKIKNVSKLQDRSYREQTGLFFFEGVHLLEEFLRHKHKPHSLFVTKSAMDSYGSIINSSSCENIYTVTDEVFSKISTEKAPQGIITVSEYLENIIVLKTDDDYNDFAKNINKGCLILDSLQDNGNVGTIIRTSAALGVQCVLSKDCADIYSYKTIRATMGALFSSKIYIALSLPDLISCIKKNSKRVFASALKENSLTLGEFIIGKADSFVVGNEGRGISKNVIEVCDETVKIPMTDAAESLNASAAATIFLWEMSKSN